MPRLSRRVFVAAPFALLGAAAAPPLNAASALQAPWNTLLQSTVSSAGWVDYPRIEREFLGPLSRYLEALASADARALGDANAELAFWLNAYNALCVRTLLAAKLPAEVPHAKLFGRNIFSERHYTIAGERRSLDDIEHGIIRKRFVEPRIHAAIVCGASSCPKLRSEAYRGEQLSAQLDDQCRSWLQWEKTRSGRRKNYLDRRSGIYHASKIFDWYEDDFGGNDAAVLSFIRRFVSEEDRKFMSSRELELAYLPYDWRLNRQ